MTPFAAYLAPRAPALAVLGAVLAADLALKLWAQAALTEPVRILSWLYFTLHRNDGIFLGALPVAQVALLYWLAIGAAALWIGSRMFRSPEPIVRIVYALVAAGLVGNVLGRFDGAVVDYLAFGPVAGNDQWMFVNLADAALIGGGIVLGCVLVRDRVRQLKRRQCSRLREDGPARPRQPGGGATFDSTPCWMGQRMVRTQSRAIAAGYALIVGGLAGNALDRVQGAVVDYFVIGPVAEGQWLAVNASDLALLAGALILGVVMVRGMRLSRDRTGACGSRSCRAGSR